MRYSRKKRLIGFKIHGKTCSGIAYLWCKSADRINVDFVVQALFSFMLCWGLLKTSYPRARIISQMVWYLKPACWATRCGIWHL